MLSCSVSLSVVCIFISLFVLHQSPSLILSYGVITHTSPQHYISILTEASGTEDPLSGCSDGDGEGDESMSSRPRPVWLETLLRKYAREVMMEDSSGNGSNSNSCSGKDAAVTCPPVGLPPVGSFCAFLSCCALRQVATSRAEEEAMLEVDLCYPFSLSI